MSSVIYLCMQILSEHLIQRENTTTIPFTDLLTSISYINDTQAYTLSYIYHTYNIHTPTYNIHTPTYNIYSYSFHTHSYTYGILDRNSTCELVKCGGRRYKTVTFMKFTMAKCVHNATIKSELCHQILIEVAGFLLLHFF